MANQATTRPKHMAYSMLVLFDIHMPLLYGEGTRAFRRLLEEIIKVTDDQTIFCWEWDRNHVPDTWASILAPCPSVFSKSGSFVPAKRSRVK